MAKLAGPEHQWAMGVSRKVAAGFGVHRAVLATGAVHGMMVELGASELATGRRWEVVGDGYERWRQCW